MLQLSTIFDRSIDRLELKKQLRDIVQFHVDILEWVFKYIFLATILLIFENVSYFDILVDILNGFLLATMASGEFFFAVLFQFSIQCTFVAWIFRLFDNGNHCIAYVCHSDNEPSQIFPLFIIFYRCIHWKFRPNNASIKSYWRKDRTV